MVKKPDPQPAEVPATPARGGSYTFDPKSAVYTPVDPVTREPIPEEPPEPPVEGATPKPEEA